MSQRLVKHECTYQTVKIFRYETGEWDRSFKLVYLKTNTDSVTVSDQAGGYKFPSEGIQRLQAILERYQTLDLPPKISACVLKETSLEKWR